MSYVECFGAFILPFEGLKLYAIMKKRGAKRAALYEKELEQRRVALGSAPELPTAAEIVNLAKQDVAPRGKDIPHYERLMAEFIQGFSPIAYARAVFRTGEGNWLGLGPQTARLGDELWLFVGAPLPLW